jgi:glycosyltransferase involved in cell wall biosynthesis
MKILMIIPSAPSKIGGAERQLAILKKSLSEKKIKTIILTNKKNAFRFFFLLKIVFFILNHFKYINIIHVHSVNSPALIASIIGKILSIPTVVKVTRNGKNSALSIYEKTLIGRFYLYLLKKFAFKFICLSSFAKKEMLSKNFNEKKLVIVPNGVEIKKVLKEKTKNKNLYVVVCRLIKRKKVDEIIKSFKKIFKNKKKKLLIVGDGPELGNLKKLDKNLKSKAKIYFLKNKKNSYVLEKIETCSFFIMNSNSEGLSNAMLEAMSKKLVIISKKLNSNKDILRHNFNCLEFENSKGLEKILTKKYNPNFLKKLGKNSLITVEKRFDIEIISKKYIDLYKKILEKKYI